MANEYRVGVIGSTGRGNYGHGLDTVWREFPKTKVVAVADDNRDGLAKAVAGITTVEEVVRVTQEG